ncbi:hypothetical protein HDU77_010693 [Chytriomyces hyalinus]|nr:hypothetical protein HDU77_010693 [Chytriomyces hyalinus]
MSSKERIKDNNPTTRQQPLDRNNNRHVAAVPQTATDSKQQQQPGPPSEQRRGRTSKRYDEYVAQKMLAKSKLEEREVGSRTKTAAATSRSDAAKPIPTKEASRKDANNIRLRVATDIAITNPDDDRSTTTTTPQQRRRPRHDSNSSITEDTAELHVNKRPPAQSARTPTAAAGFSATTSTPKRVLDKNASSSNGRLESPSSDLKSGQRARRNPPQTASDTESEGHSSRSRRNVKKPEAAAVSATSVSRRPRDISNTREDKEPGSSSKDASNARVRQVTSPLTRHEPRSNEKLVARNLKKEDTSDSSDGEAAVATKLSKPKLSKTAAVLPTQSQSTDSLSENEAPKLAKDAKLSKSRRIQPIDSEDESIPISSKPDAPQRSLKKGKSATARAHISDSSDAEPPVKLTKPSKRQSNQSSDDDDDSDHERITKKNVAGTSKVETVKSPASSKLLSKSAAKSKPKQPEISDSSDNEQELALEADEPNLARASPNLGRKVQQPESIKVELVEQAVKSKQQRRRDVSDSSDGEIERAKNIATESVSKASKSKKKGMKEDKVASKVPSTSETESKQQQQSPEPPQISENLEPKTDAKKSSKRQKDQIKKEASREIETKSSKSVVPKESSHPPVAPQNPITKPTTVVTEPKASRSRPTTNFKKLSGKRRSCVIMIANPKLREIVKRRALATTKQHGRFELLKESSVGSDESKVDLDDGGLDVEEVDAWSDAEQDVVVAAIKTGGKSAGKSIVKAAAVAESIVASQVSSQPLEPKKKSSSNKKADKQQSKSNGSGKRGDLDFEKELHELELLEDKVAAAADEIKKSKDVEKPKNKQVVSKSTEAPRAVVEDLSQQQQQSKKTDDGARVSSSSSSPGSKRTKPDSGSQNPKDLKDKKVSKYDADSASSSGSSSDESHHSSSFRNRGQRKLARKSSQESSSAVKRKNGSNNSRKIESSDDDGVKEDVAVKPSVPKRKSPTVPYRRKISSDTSDAEADGKASPFSNKKASSESLVSNNNIKARAPSPKRRSSMSGSSEDEKVLSRKGTNASKQGAEKSPASRIQNAPSASIKAADSSNGKVVEKKLLDRMSEQSTFSDSRAYQLPPRRTQYSDDSSDAEDHHTKGRDDEKVGKSVAKDNHLQKPVSNNSRIKSPQRRAAMHDSSDEDEHQKRQSDDERVAKPVAKDNHLQKPVSNNSRIKSPQRRAAMDDSSDEEQHQEKRREEKSSASQKPTSNNSRIKSPQRRAVDQSSSDEETFKSQKSAAPILRKTTANSSKEAISSRDAPPIRVHSPRRRDSLMSSDDEKSVRRQSSVKIPSRSGSMKRPSRSESLKRPDRSESLKRQAARNEIERPGSRKNASRSRKTDDSSDEDQDRPTRKVTSPRTRRPPSGMSVHSEVSARRNRGEVKVDTPSLISLAESRISIPSASPSPNMTDKPPKLRISQLSRVKNEYPDSDDSTATKEPIRKAPSPVVLSPKPSPRSSLTNPTPSPPTQKTGFFRSLWGGGGSKPAAGATPSNQGSAASVAEVAPPTPLKEFESDKNPSMGRSIASSATSVSQSTTTSVPEKVEAKTEVEGAPKKTVLGWIFGVKKPAVGGAQGAQVGDSKTSSDVLEDANADAGRKSEDVSSDSDSGSDKSRRSTMKGLGIQRRRSESVSSQEKEKPQATRRYSDSSSEEETRDRRPGQSVSQTRRGNPAGSSPQVNAAGRPLRGGRPQESHALGKHPNESKSVRQDGNPTRRVVGRRADPVDDLSDFSAVSD